MKTKYNIGQKVWAFVEKRYWNTGETRRFITNGKIITTIIVIRENNQGKQTTIDYDITLPKSLQEDEYTETHTIKESDIFLSLDVLKRKIAKRLAEQVNDIEIFK